MRASVKQGQLKMTLIQIIRKVKREHRTAEHQWWKFTLTIHHNIPQTKQMNVYNKATTQKKNNSKGLF